MENTDTSSSPPSLPKTSKYLKVDLREIARELSVVKHISGGGRRKTARIEGLSCLGTARLYICTGALC